MERLSIAVCALKQHNRGERGVRLPALALLALMFCTKIGKTGIPDKIGCEPRYTQKNLTHIGRTCKINQ